MSETRTDASAPTSPFKILRAGKEVPPDELPIHYAMAQKVIIPDMELDIQHPHGKVENLLEYASPLYDEQGAFHLLQNN